MKKYDVIIIGGGPGGLTAALYASRGNLKTLFIEKGAPGGKIVNTSKIENWIGEEHIQGPDLALKMFEHAKKFGATYKYGDVVSIDSSSEFDHSVKTSTGEEFFGKAVIVATGMRERIPQGVEGIEKLKDRGVSYCAICDGPLYAGKNVAVIGGGNSAIEEASYLASVSANVFVFVRNALSAEKMVIDELDSKKNAKVFLKHKPLKIGGETAVESILLDTPQGETEFKVSAVFPYIGQDPNTEFLPKECKTDQRGFIQTNHLMETSIPGLYAVGDVRKKDIRQIATAVADGTIVGKILANKISP